jgi:hypothetical protein
MHRMLKSTGDEIVVIEVDDECRQATSKNFFEGRMLIRAVITDINESEDDSLFTITCRVKYVIKWIALRYKPKEGVLMTVYPLLGKMIIEGKEIEILKADGSL